jgi:two-component system response regulator AtoC
LRILCERIVQIARTDAGVLIEGESGTGKELVARAIHYYSQRRENPYVGLNCGAISDSLLGSELFGHVAGAFSGAIADKQGLVEQARGGTLLIDEASEMSHKMQVEILRWAQEREYRRVGESAARSSDVRLIVASNQDLAGLVRGGRFRGDLFYRFKVAVIRIPPLRERPEDVQLLIERFTETHARRCGRQRVSISTAAMDVLLQYPWPGNVRELEHCFQGLLTNPTEHLGADEVLAYLDAPNEASVPEILRTNESTSLSGASSPNVWRRHVELPRLPSEETKRRYQQAYFEYGGNRTAMARALSTSASQVRRKIREYKLEG